MPTGFEQVVDFEVHELHIIDFCRYIEEKTGVPTEDVPEECPVYITMAERGITVLSLARKAFAMYGYRAEISPALITLHPQAAA